MLGKATDNWGDPKYWGSVANMLLMVLVLTKVVSGEEREKIVAFAKDFVGELF